MDGPGAAGVARLIAAGFPAMRTDAPTKDGRTVRAFNLLSRNERVLFEVLLAGEHALHGFTNRVVRQQLARTPYPLAPQAEKQPGHAPLPAPSCARPHRQNPSFAPLLGFPRRSKDNVHRDQTQESPYPSLFATAA